MSTLAAYLGTGALAPHVEDFEAEGLTGETLFAISAEVSSLDDINRKQLSDAAKNAFWLRKLLYESSPSLLAEHGDKFEAIFQTENGLRALTWEDLKSQLRDMGVKLNHVIALHIKLGHATPFSPPVEITPEQMAEMKAEMTFDVPGASQPIIGVKRPLEDPTKVQQKKEKQQRKKKDKNAPKRARSAYLVFLDRNRAGIMQQNPAMPMCEVTKILANRWAMVTSEEKAICEIEAAKDKVRYDNDLKAYNLKTAESAQAALQELQDMQQGGAAHSVEDHSASVGLDLVHQTDSHGHQADGHQTDGHQAEADGQQADGHQAEVHQADGHQADGHQADGHVDGALGVQYEGSEAAI